jgi:hypothetical protein
MSPRLYMKRINYNLYKKSSPNFIFGFRSFLAAASHAFGLVEYPLMNQRFRCLLSRQEKYVRNDISLFFFRYAISIGASMTCKDRFWEEKV